MEWKQILFAETFAMSTDSTPVALSESEQVAVEIVEELVAISVDQIIEKDLKSKCVAVYYDDLKSSLEEILEVYEKPKPRKDHSSVIEAWKRDKPAKPSKPDILSICILWNSKPSRRSCCNKIRGKWRNIHQNVQEASAFE